jgi:asparagine synthase (glutamine-hydrolysing)
MFRGFTLRCPESGPPELQLLAIDPPREGRPSLVTLARDPGARSAAILLGRIFYREDLIRRLDAPVDLSAASDAALALAAYRWQGRRGLEELEGEFALVIWDGKERRVWARRDPFGTWPIYWSIADRTLAVSTSIEPLLNERSSSSFNLDALAEYLMQPMPADELPCEQTVFDGIQRVRPGTIVEFDGIDQVSRHTWWDWPSRIRPNEETTLEAAGEKFASLLRDAVRQRIPRNGRLASHLSGGMDSSSLVCLARDELAARNSPKPLCTLSMVYQRQSLVVERSFIDALLEQGGPVDPHFLEGDEVLYFDWFQKELPRHDEPSGHLRSMPFHRALVEAADRIGAVMTLSGEGSDEIVTYQPFHMADLLRQGHWLKAVKEASRWGYARYRGMWSVLSNTGLMPLWPIWWREGWGPFFRRGYGVWPRLGFFSIPPWVRPDFARRYQLRQRGRGYARQLFGSPTQASWDSFILAITSGDWQRWHLAAPLGLNLSHPFRDPRLVCYALGLSRNLRGVPGLTKPILETAMRGTLPEKIRTKRCSPGFSDLYGLGLRRNMLQLEQMVRNSAIRDLGIVDPDELIPAMHKAALGIGDSQATDRLEKTLALIAWFDHIRERRPSSARVVAAPLDAKPGAAHRDLARLTPCC